jgi:hypothetical protein
VGNLAAQIKALLMECQPYARDPGGTAVPGGELLRHHEAGLQQHNNNSNTTQQHNNTTTAAAYQEGVRGLFGRPIIDFT